jgi:hypothetical protein
VVNLAFLNLSLNLRHCVIELQDIGKMNDRFAVRLFCLGNLLILMTEEDSNCRAICYLLLFILWYAAIAVVVTVTVASLDPQLRLNLLSISFHILRDWL